MSNNKIIEQITTWSEVFNAPIKQEEGFPSEERYELALRLIKEEYNETRLAVVGRDMVEVKDGLGDLLWVTVRAMMEFGINIEKTMEAIYISNMSKVDTSSEDAKLTRNKYATLGIDTYSKLEGDYYITYRKADDKILKSHKFQPPNFSL